MSLANDRGTSDHSAVGGDQNLNGTPPPLKQPLVFSLTWCQCNSWLVPVIVFANVVIFGVVMFVNNCPKHTESHCVPKFLGRLSFEPLRSNPLFGPSNGTNMITLAYLGFRLEQEFGFVKIGIIYIVSGVGGSILSSLFIRNSISNGASSAICGLIGSLLSEVLTNWSIYTYKVAAVLTLLFGIISSLAFGILPHIDNFAHLGGLFSGFLLGFVLLARPPFKPYQFLMCLLSLTVFIAGFVVALLMLLREEDGNDYCSWCHYLRCVPTSRWSCDGV
ncbi:hypothetical protein AALP_AA6G347100 [Arabis alpina]|uniref:RHOMBOID-like protein n=1 Tax=Arabis alpina TaxID=50452 RepID=A0A087GTM7_ARAAL|nr:hypothetical protein AALP_AA6G347100 [Arabis alpina]